MRGIFIILLFSIFIIYGLAGKEVAYAENTNTDLYQFEKLVQEKKYDTAQQYLLQREQSILSSVEERAPEQISNMEKYLDKNYQTLHENGSSQVKKMKHAQQLVVYYDAVMNEQAPMFHAWLEELKYNLETKLGSNQLSEEDRMEIHYQWEVIAPVLKSYVSEAAYKEMKENIIHLNDDKLPLAYEQISDVHVSTVQSADSENYFVWLMSIVGLFIIFSLSYVSWVRYKAESSTKHTN
ncbi:sporulation protein YpjB [Gracilibacillus sp. YIM 98692]|uniref:sporulation protein YpjB n=1 Tax=Gracilibacillus sp. YIM 98692 TaxID=2663532 RepID=UPI0013CF5A3B|nr:sporulation protein YpjB [Gracilibacillus sp. YIM 98692]